MKKEEMIRVGKRGFIHSTSGNNVSYLDEQSVPLTEFLEGLRMAISQRDNLDEVILNMKKMLRESLKNFGK